MKLRILRSQGYHFGLSAWSLNPITSVLLREAARRDTQRERTGVKREAERRMRPRSCRCASSHQQLGGVPPRASAGSAAWPEFGRLAPGTVGEHTSVAVRHRVCGDLVWQSQGTAHRMSVMVLGSGSRP